MYIGIDLGGTKTEVVCLSETGEELVRRRVPSPQGSYDATIKNLKTLVENLEQEVGRLCPVGLGMPGSINPKTQTVRNSNSVWLNGRTFKRDLEAVLCREIVVENDANCFTLSEYKDGAAQGASSVFGVIIGTGCGGGLMIDGHLVRGENSLAGEWGHNPLPFPLIKMSDQLQQEQFAFFDKVDKTESSTIYANKKAIDYYAQDDYAIEYPGPACYCGKRGCLETWLSGPGFSQDYQRLGGDRLSAIEIVELSYQGHTLALQCLDRFYERLAKSLAYIVNVFDPAVIVCGGGMSNIASIYQEVAQRWGKYIFAEQWDTQIRKAKHGDASGVRGAAWLCSSQ